LLSPKCAEVLLRQVKPVPAEIASRLRREFDPVNVGQTQLPWLPHR
jgi:hypothetical protein